MAEQVTPPAGIPPTKRQEPPATLVLVGAPGAGKSTVGARLARRLGRDFTDVDALVEERAGMAISDIFLTRGEPAFREMEREVTLEVLERPGVVSLGGGAVMDPAIRAALAGHHVIWLDVNAHHASRRVGLTGANRPLLAGNVHSTMVRLMQERLPLYREVATVRVDTNGLKTPAVVRHVLVLLGVDEAADEPGAERSTEQPSGPAGDPPRPDDDAGAAGATTGQEE